jgi:hypothetical protein
MPVIPANQEEEIKTGRSTVHGQPKQNVSETHSQQASQVWWDYRILIVQEVQVGGPWFKASEGKRTRPYLKK